MENKHKRYWWVERKMSGMIINLRFGPFSSNRFIDHYTLKHSLDPKKLVTYYLLKLNQELCEDQFPFGRFHTLTPWEKRL